MSKIKEIVEKYGHRLPYNKYLTGEAFADEIKKLYGKTDLFSLHFLKNTEKRFLRTKTGITIYEASRKKSASKTQKNGK